MSRSPPPRGLVDFAKAKGQVAGREAETRQARPMDKFRSAKFRIGEVVRHRFFPFRGVIFDVDPVFDNTEEWWQAIPAEIRPAKDQPFYHLLAENAESEYIAYVSEQNLVPDESNEPLRHPQIAEFFDQSEGAGFRARHHAIN